MSTLLVHELDGSGDRQQKILIGESNQNLVSVRVHLYRHNFPTGNLRVDLYDAAGSILLKSSEEIAISLLDKDNGTGEAFYHGQIRFLINYWLAPATEYFVRVVTTGGYSFSEAAYVGIVNDYDLN